MHHIIASLLVLIIVRVHPAANVEPILTSRCRCTMSSLRTPFRGISSMTTARSIRARSLASSRMLNTRHGPADMQADAVQILITVSMATAAT
jgi:hypothetical protein